MVSLGTSSNFVIMDNNNNKSLENSDLLLKIFEGQKEIKSLLRKLSSSTESNTENILRGKRLTISTKSAMNTRVADLGSELRLYHIDEVSQLTLFRLFDLDKQVATKARELLGSNLSSPAVHRIVALILGRQYKKVNKLLNSATITWWDELNGPRRDQSALMTKRKENILKPTIVNRVFRDLSKTGLKSALVKKLIKAGSLPEEATVIFD